MSIDENLKIITLIIILSFYEIMLMFLIINVLMCSIQRGNRLLRGLVLWHYHAGVLGPEMEPILSLCWWRLR